MHSASPLPQSYIRENEDVYLLPYDLVRAALAPRRNSHCGGDCRAEFVDRGSSGEVLQNFGGVWRVRDSVGLSVLVGN